MRDAIADGEMDESRLVSYRKLSAEQRRLGAEIAGAETSGAEVGSVGAEVSVVASLRLAGLPNACQDRLLAEVVSEANPVGQQLRRQLPTRP